MAPFGIVVAGGSAKKVKNVWSIQKPDFLKSPFGLKADFEQFPNKC